MPVCNWDFDIAGIIIGTAIFIIYKTSRNLNTWQNNIFQLLVIMYLSSCVFEIAACNSLIFGTNRHAAFVFVLNVLFLYAINTTSLVYYFFIISMVINRDDINYKWRLSAWLPYAAVNIFVWPAANDKIYYFDSMSGIFQKSFSSVALFVITSYYILLSLFITIKYSNRLSLKQRSVSVVYTVATSIAIVCELFFPEYLLMNFAISVCLIFIFMTLQNPLEFRDSDTNVYNSKAFSRIIRQLVCDKKNFFVVGIKLDGLDIINERLGLEQGNLLISEFSDFLLRFHKRVDAFHLSGVKFSLIVSDLKEASDIEQHIQQRFLQPFCCGVIQVALGGYLCRCNFPDDFSNAKELFDIMSYILDMAEQSKRKDIVYDKQRIAEQEKHDIAVKFAIQDSIENRSFEVYFQPILSVLTEKFTRAEALVRMNVPGLNFVPPDEFIPKAEKTGQIIKIGEIVLEKCCRCLSENRLQDYGITMMNVNLSAVQCIQPGLSQSLKQIVDKYHIPHAMIDFEITESAAVTANAIFLENIKLLQQMGFSFSLDDFGTGYSNITKIIDTCYEVIKIDKSLVWAADTSLKGEIVLKNISVALKELETSILAEGIETIEQAQRLKKYGCDYFQGYLFSKPLPEKQFVQFMKMQKAS